MKPLKVKILLLERDLTQADIARACGISPTAVSLILFGQRPGYRYQRRIAQILGVKMSDLFASTKRRKPGRRVRFPIKMAKPTRRQADIMNRETGS